MIGNAVVANGDGARLEKYAEVDFTPFDPVTKRTEATVDGPDGRMEVCKGATTVVLEMCADKDKVREQVMSANDALAKRGFRSLGVAVKREGGRFGGGGGWQFMGVLSLFDPPRHDTADTLANAREQGIVVKMVTGDQQAIAIETSKSIALGVDHEKGLEPKILDMARFQQAEDEAPAVAARLCEDVDGFAGVYVRPPSLSPLSALSLSRILGI